MHRNRYINTPIVIILLAVFLLPNIKASSTPLEIVPEGRDYATQVLHDPWDMEQFSDISQYLNNSGQAANIQNISVANGLFSAQAISDAQFSILFPGYRTTTGTGIPVGKLGIIYPIATATYNCLYIAMQVNTSGYDVGQIFWFKDDKLNGTGGVWGGSSGFLVTNQWQLYKINLASFAMIDGNTEWHDQPSWQGLRIDPTIQAGVNFNVDWVRLTDCNPITKSIDYTAGSDVSVYIKPYGTSREIQVVAGTSERPYRLDVQGIDPGDYTYIVKRGGSQIATGDFTVNHAPLVTIDKPSMTSGEDYATAAGNAWDMSDPIDATETPYENCLIESWGSGLLAFDTPDVSVQSGNCKGGGYNDPILYLNTPTDFDPTQYRYLSYRIYNGGQIQNVPDGYIARWGWTYGAAENACEAVAGGIPFDVGWNTYSFDLSGSYNGISNGTINEKVGTCPAGIDWSTTGPIQRVRFDPNENQIGSTLHQELDWIKLTKMDSVQSGTDFRILISFGELLQGSQLSFYYTSDLANPTQHAVIQSSSITPSTGPYSSYFPYITTGSGESDYTTKWVTNGIGSGNYYICVVATDGFNTTTTCSDAPVNIHP